MYGSPERGYHDNYCRLRPRISVKEYWSRRCVGGLADSTSRLPRYWPRRGGELRGRGRRFNTHFQASGPLVGGGSPVAKRSPSIMHQFGWRSAGSGAEHAFWPAGAKRPGNCTSTSQRVVQVASGLGFSRGSCSATRGVFVEASFRSRLRTTRICRGDGLWADGRLGGRMRGARMAASLVIRAHVEAASAVCRGMDGAGFSYSARQHIIRRFVAGGYRAHVSWTRLIGMA